MDPSSRTEETDSLEEFQFLESNMAEVQEAPPQENGASGNGVQENGNAVQWTLGDEEKEIEDVFPQNDDDENQPPAAPSDGQGNRRLSKAAQAALIEKRKRLK